MSEHKLDDMSRAELINEIDQLQEQLRRAVSEINRLNGVIDEHVRQASKVVLANYKPPSFEVARNDYQCRHDFALRTEPVGAYVSVPDATMITWSDDHKQAFLDRIEKEFARRGRDALREAMHKITSA